MKLVVVFVLAAIPICCYASGSGCDTMDTMINLTIDPSVSVDDYHAAIKETVHIPYDEEAVTKFKKCFLNQTSETLENMKVMMDAIYDSKDCSDKHKWF